MDNKAAIARMKELIEQKRYADARKILEKIDHPLKDSWLLKIDTLIAKEQRQRPAEAAPIKSSTVERRAASPERKPTPASRENIAESEKPKRTPNLFPNIALIAGLLTVVIGGIGGGILLFLSSKLIYLIFLSPIIAGGVLGLVIAYALTTTKARQPIAAAVFGVLIGLVGYATFRYAEYLDFVQTVRTDMIAEGDISDPAEADLIINEYLLEETGKTGFIGYVMLEAQEGMSVKSTSPLGRESAWSSEMTVLYWIAELAALTVIPAMMVHHFTSEPFCEATNQWLKFNQIGTISYDRRNEFLQLLSQDYFAEAAALMKDERKLRRVRLYVTAGRCHDQSPEAMIRVREHDGRNQKVIIKRTITADQFRDLTSA